MEKQNFDEIVQFAIDSEQEAVDAYTTASEIVTRKSVKDMLLGLARQEEMHKRKLQSIDRERVESAAIVEVPDLKIADYTDDVTVTPNMGYQDILPDLPGSLFIVGQIEVLSQQKCTGLIVGGTRCDGRQQNDPQKALSNVFHGNTVFKSW